MMQIPDAVKNIHEMRSMRRNIQNNKMFEMLVQYK